MGFTWLTVSRYVDTIMQRCVKRDEVREVKGTGARRCSKNSGQQLQVVTANRGEKLLERALFTAAILHPSSG